MNIYNSSGIGVVPSLFTDRGGVTTKTNLAKLNEDVRIILMTSRGTQIGDPNFGSDLYKIIHYGNNSATAARIRNEIDRVLELYYPEIQITSIDIEFVGNTINIYIYYNIQYSNVNSNVTLEFIQGETSSNNY